MGNLVIVLVDCVAIFLTLDEMLPFFSRRQLITNFGTYTLGQIAKWVFDKTPSKKNEQYPRYSACYLVNIVMNPIS